MNQIGKFEGWIEIAGRFIVRRDSPGRVFHKDVPISEYLSLSPETMKIIQFFFFVLNDSLNDE